jgi:hypothetical protein
MANISLKRLFEAEDFKAKSKETGKLVHFKSKDSYQAALKAGTHEDPNAKKGDKPKADIKPNSMFGKDYSKDRGAKAAPKSNANWMDDLDSIDTSDVKGKANPSADSWTHGDVFDATFKDPQTGKPISVGDAYDREDDSPAYQKAFAYVAQFNPDDEAVMGTQAYSDLQKNAAPKVDVKSIIKGLLKNADREFRGAYKLKDVVDGFQDNIDDSDDDGKELKARLDKGEDGTYVQTDETEGTVVFNDGSQYEFSHVEDGPIPVTKVGKEEPKTSSKLTSMLPKKASQLDDTHAENVSTTLNKEAGLDGYAQTDDNSGAIMYNASKGEMPTYTLYMGSNDDYGKPDEFRVSLEPTYGNDPSKLQGKIDKSFKSAQDANTFMIAVAKKYKKELEMDDSED